MTNDTAKSAKLAELRKRAETQLKREMLDVSDMPLEKTRELIHELRTHQIELEMQNEELRRAQEEVIELRVQKNGGEPFWAKMESIAVRDAAKNASGFRTAISDITDRKRAKQDLRESQERYQRVTEGTNGIVYSFVVGSGATYWSPNVADELGYQPDWLRDNPMHWHDSIHPDDVVAVDEVLAAVEPGQAHELEYRIRRSTGEWIWLRDRFFVRGDEDGSTVVDGVAVDVTERKRAEENLEESERRAKESLAELELMYRTAPIGLALLDTDLRYVRINDTLAAINGRPASEHIGRSVYELLPKQLATETELVLRRVIETGQSELDLEVHSASLVDRDSERDCMVSYHPIKDAGGKVFGVGAVVQDITEHKQADEALRQLNEELEAKVAERTEKLRESHDFIRTISDAATYFLWVYDLNEEHFVHMNKSLAQFFGISPDADFPLAGTVADRLIHSDDVPIRAACREAQNGEILDRELRLKDQAGQWHWFLARSVVLNRNPDGSPRQLLGTAVDLTKRKEVERQLQQRTAELARFARVSTVGEMASGLAHQLNQPLVAISLQSEVCAKLLERMEKGRGLDELRDAFQEITNQAQRAGRAIGFVRGFVCDQPPHRSTHDVHEVILGVIQVLDGEARQADTRIRYQPTTDLPYVLIDRVQVEQVILNLLRNAIEAMGETEPSDRFVVIATKAASDQSIQISVSDRGKGIAEPDLDKVFESFFTTKPGGMGLGLSICRGIVEAHEGRLWVTRNSDRGMTFRFTIARGHVSGNPTTSKARTDS